MWTKVHISVGYAMSALILVCGALCSTFGTMAVKRSANFRRFGPAALAIACYGGSTWFLAQAMASMPVAFAHAAWSGLVALLLLAIDYFYLKLKMAPAQIVGFFGVIAGIALLSIGQ